MSDKKQYIFGPVASRRLGLSLGVDIVPFKVCTLDCIYCQLGTTTEKSLTRKPYAPVGDVLAELNERLSQGIRADYITISGSGEPTLHCELGRIIDGIKRITHIPVALLTNGTLLSDESVRADCGKADVILPSLDAGDESTFQKISRPTAGGTIEKLISGLCALREAYAGQIWLEVFLVEGLNTGAEQIANIQDAINRIRPDKVQLNTAVRPTTEADVQRPALEKLTAIAGQIGGNCEIIADYYPGAGGKHVETKVEYVLSMLKRRPCSVADISAGLEITSEQAEQFVRQLKHQGLIKSHRKEQTVFYKVD